MTDTAFLACRVHLGIKSPSKWTIDIINHTIYIYLPIYMFTRTWKKWMSHDIEATMCKF